MKRAIYKGYYFDFDFNLIGFGKFVIFGEMSDGSKCYHLINNEDGEIEGLFYQKMLYNGRYGFIASGLE